MAEQITAWRGPRFYDARGRWRTALTSRGGLVVGFDEAAGAAAKVEQLPEGWALPGFIDSHAHLGRLGARPDDLAFEARAPLSEVLETVRAQAAARAQGEWITGHGWLTLGQAPPPQPTHEALTHAAPLHPVALRRADAHALWVNRAAMARAQITAQTPDPAGGVIVRDAHGEPTGLFIDAAADLVTGLIPPPSAQALEAMVLEEAAVMLSQGVTCVHEMATDARLWWALQSLDREGLLPLRVRSFLWAAAPAWAADARAAAVWGAGPDPRPVLGGAAAVMLRRVGLKLFADGALGSMGARLSRPYGGGGWGVQPDSAELFRATIDAAKRGGWQVAVHAIGDAAVLEVVALLAAHQPRGGRWRVEHVQIAPPEALAQMARAGLCAAAQPIHAAHDLPWASPLLGPHLTAVAYPWQRLWAQGIPTGLGSDYPIESANVREGLFAATQRAAPDAPRVTLPGSAERLTRAQALHGYTAGAAALTFDEAALGALGPGRACDLCVWDRDLTACPPLDLLDAKLRAVVVNGARVR